MPAVGHQEPAVVDRPGTLPLDYVAHLDGDQETGQIPNRPDAELPDLLLVRIEVPADRPVEAGRSVRPMAAVERSYSGHEGAPVHAGRPGVRG